MTSDESVLIKRRQVEELQAIIDNAEDTKQILDHMMEKVEAMNGALATELILRVTRKEEIV